MRDTGIKLDLDDEDARKLYLLAHAMHCSEAEVLRSALRQLYDKAVADKRILLPSDEAFDALREALDSPLTEDGRIGRERLKAVEASLWEE